MGFREHWDRWAPLVISVAVLLGLGALAFSLVRSSNVAAQEAVGEGAISKQRTVAALTDQYLQLAAKEAFDLDVAAPLELTADSAADAEALQSLLSRQGGFFDHAARLTDLGGDPLTRVGGEVPPSHEAAYQPLKASLIRNEPGVSSLMWVDDVPVVAVGVPVLRDGIPAAMLVAFFRAGTSMLQHYSEELGDGDGIGMVVSATSASNPTPCSVRRTPRCSWPRIAGACATSSRRRAWPGRPPTAGPTGPAPTTCRRPPGACEPTSRCGGGSDVGFGRGWPTRTLAQHRTRPAGRGATVPVAVRRPDPVPEVFGYHEVWHLLVVLAVVLHYAMVGIVVASPSTAMAMAGGG